MDDLIPQLCNRIRGAVWSPEPLEYSNIESLFVRARRSLRQNDRLDWLRILIHEALPVNVKEPPHDRGLAVIRLANKQQIRHARTLRLVHQSAKRLDNAVGGRISDP